MRVENRNIVTAVILSIITCGIYSYYWFYKQLDDLYKLNGMESKAAMDLVLSLITCGIYYIYMSYKMGRLLDGALGGRGSDRSILFLILTIFGLSIVNFCIIQSELNNNFSDGGSVQ